MRRKNERSSPKQKEGPSLERPESDELVKDRNRRKRPKMDAKQKKIACPLLDVFACGQVSSPRLYRLRDKN